ncbi:MAG: TIGR04063 family PEP-CTERM/XrtA system glycosyltransferase [Pseudomonadota bacterium]
MSLRVVHVLDHSIPLHSGYAFRTVSILREQRKLGWETLQVTTPKQGSVASREEAVDGFTFLRSRGDGSQNLLTQMSATADRLREAVASFKPHLLHAHSPVLTALPALRVGKRFGLPVVYEMRASWEDASVDHGTTTVGSLRYRLSKHLETYALRRAQHLTTICEGLRREIVSRGIAANRVTVIPNAVDIEKFEYHGGSNLQSKQQIGVGDSPTIGFIGSFYGYEGLDDLISAVAILKQREVSLNVILVGGGPEEENLRADVARLGLEDCVRFVGRVDQSEVGSYYRAIDLLVYPRKKTRLTDMVTPLKPLESMAQGNLVLASDVGGHIELVRDGETGVLFPADSVESLASAIQTTLADTGRWEQIRVRGREFVMEERNWTRSVSGYHQAYGAALASKGLDLSGISNAEEKS